MKALGIVVLLSLAGCSVQATPNPRQIVHCKDFRDGEEWTWRSENIAVYVGLSVSTVEGHDENGKKHSVSSDNPYIKCERVSQ